LVGSIFHMTRKIVSEMTYNVSMGTLNPTIPYQVGWLGLRVDSHLALFYIHWMNWVNSQNDLCHDGSTITLSHVLLLILLLCNSKWIVIIVGVNCPIVSGTSSPRLSWKGRKTVVLNGCMSCIVVYSIREKLMHKMLQARCKSADIVTTFMYVSGNVQPQICAAVSRRLIMTGVCVEDSCVYIMYILIHLYLLLCMATAMSQNCILV